MISLEWHFKTIETKLKLLEIIRIKLRQSLLFKQNWDEDHINPNDNLIIILMN